MSLINILNSKQRPLSSPKFRCYTCLTLDRNLNPLKDKCLLSILCPEMFPKAMANAQYLICWECEFMILKIKRFQAKLMKAHATLKLSMRGIITVVEELSNLKPTAVETINILPPTIPTPIQNEQSMELVKSEEHTVQIKIEKSESLSGDYDELIEPTAIHQLSSGQSTDTATGTDIHMCDDPLLTLPPDKPITQMKKYLEIDVPALQPVKYAIIAPNVQLNCTPPNTLNNVPPLQSVKYAIIAPNAKLNCTPPKTFINTPLENMSLKGLLEAVTVTSGFSNLVSKEIPSPLNGEETVPVHVKESVSQASSGEVEQWPGLYGDEEDEATCKVLNKTEMETYRQKKRQVQWFKGCRYKCEKCIERFNTQQSFDEHNKKHDEASGNSICDVCEQRFPDDSVRDEHYKAHFIVYECVKCPYQNPKRLAISEHIRRTHKVSLFNCRKCDAVFKTFKEQRQHTIKVHYKKQTCEECGKTYTGRFALKAHIANAHRKETAECPICKKKVRKYSLRYHMKIHNELRDDSAYCVDCGTVYKNKICYEMHLKTSLKHNKVEQLGIKCDHCNEYFSSKTSLKNHMDEINDVKYSCDICNKDLRTKRSLIRHIQWLHEGRKRTIKSSICEICGKSFTKKLTLQNHINSHLGLRPYVCKDCGDTFSYSSALFTHRRLVHKVKRRYEMTS